MSRKQTANWGAEKKRTKDICVKLQQMLSLLRRGLFLCCGEAGEKEKESARTSARGMLFPSSHRPRALSIFSIIAIFIGIPSAARASAEETATDEWRTQWYCVICSRLHSHSLCRHATLLPRLGSWHQPASTELMRNIVITVRGLRNPLTVIKAPLPTHLPKPNSKQCYSFISVFGFLRHD